MGRRRKTHQSSGEQTLHGSAVTSTGRHTHQAIPVCARACAAVHDPRYITQLGEAMAVAAMEMFARVKQPPLGGKWAEMCNKSIKKL